MKYDSEFAMPSVRVLEQEAYKALIAVGNLELHGSAIEVNANLKAAEIKTAIAQAYIDLARNLRQNV